MLKTKPKTKTKTNLSRLSESGDSSKVPKIGEGSCTSTDMYRHT